MKFRILVGKHSEGYHLGADGRRIKPKIYCADGKQDGNIIETTTDLCKMNHPGANKFQRLYESPKSSSDPEAVAEAAHEGFYGMPEDPAVKAKSDGLDGKNAAELRKIAEEEEIDLGSAKTKDQILGRIRESRHTVSS
jgi:hypothetical protein